MKNVTIFGFWILTVGLGSIIFGIIASLIDRPSANLSDSFGIIAISAILSFLFSIPAVVTFLVANTKLKDKFQNSELYQRKMYTVHFITSGIYFFVSLFTIILQGADIIGISVLISLLLSYLPIGLLCWYFGFRKIKPTEIINEEILDNL